jgi:hypothetical protein
MLYLLGLCYGSQEQDDVQRHLQTCEICVFCEICGLYYVCDDYVIYVMIM